MKDMFKKLSLLIILTAGLSVGFVQANDNPPPCHTIDISGVDVLCYGDTDGSAQISINGGSGNFTITWSTGATDQLSISDLSAGAYSVQVVDNVTGCSVNSIITINQPSALVTSISHTDINCFGDATGNIDISVTGGTTDYTYLWSNGSTAQDLSDLLAGTYQVTIMDDNGCTAFLQTEIHQPAQALGSNIELTSEVLCHDDSNAAINIDVWGGTTPYYYQWNTGAATQDLENIPAGDYDITITDDAGCSNTQSISIDNPTEMTYTTSSGNNECAGDTDGFASITVSGGTEPYNYQWANSQHMLSYNQALLENLTENTYAVTVTDAHACSVSDNFIVTTPDALELTHTETHVSQVGGNDGSIDINTTGGTGAYSFLWSNGLTTEDLSNITAGTYSITVTDDNACTITASIEITEPLEPLSFDEVHSDVSCANGNDGTIQIFPKGGVPPYLISWSNGSEITYLNNLAAGKYYCTLTDDNSIVYIDSIEIIQPEPISLTYTSNDPSCFGLNNGNIDVSISGGTEPYRYQWYDPDYAMAGISQDIENARAGEYTLIVRDTNSCENSITVLIDQPSMISLAISGEDILCHGASTGTTQLEVSGGSPDYTFLWSNGETSQNLSNLPAGEYEVSVTDNMDCEAFTSIHLSEPEEITITLIPTEVSCEAQSDGKMESIVDGGNGGFMYNWSNGDNAEIIENLTEGYYMLTVTDIFNCQAADTGYVSKNDIDCINIPSSFTPNGDSYNDTWVIRNAYLFPECSLQVLNQWGNLVFESKGYPEAWDGTYNNEVLPSGTYYYIFRVSPDHQERTGTVTILK